jgi:hypothetical protein
MLPAQARQPRRIARRIGRDLLSRGRAGDDCQSDSIEKVATRNPVHPGIRFVYGTDMRILSALYLIACRYGIRTFVGTAPEVPRS